MREPSFIIAVPVKYYQPKRVAEIYGMSKEQVLRLAFVAGALYQFGNKRLIDIFKISSFIREVKDFAGLCESKYCMVNEAANMLGIPAENIIQMASDADALRKVGDVLLINPEQLSEYIEKCQHKVEFFSQEEIELSLRNKRLTIRNSQ